jgi:hypothetical protein
MSARNFEAYQRAVRAYEGGQLDGLECPRCGTPTASVRFAPLPASADGPSSVYFACSLCGESDTAQYRGAPPYFERARVVP